MKGILKIMLVFVTLGFMSCTPSAVGTWVDTKSKTGEQGFTLYKDGSAKSTGMDFVEFKSWEKNGDFLIFNGNNTGSVKREFSDTMKIEKLTKTELTLSQGGYSVTYKKK